MKVWSQATHFTLTVPDLREHGWSVDEQGIVAVTWDTPESLTAVQELIDSLTAGCRCTTGWSTQRCKWKKASKNCSVGCRCKNCSNYDLKNVQGNTGNRHARQELSGEATDALSISDCDDSDSEDRVDSANNIDKEDTDSDN